MPEDVSRDEAAQVVSVGLGEPLPALSVEVVPEDATHGALDLDTPGGGVPTEDVGAVGPHVQGQAALGVGLQGEAWVERHQRCEGGVEGGEESSRLGIEVEGSGLRHLPTPSAHRTEGGQ